MARAGRASAGWSADGSKAGASHPSPDPRAAARALPAGPFPGRGSGMLVGRPEPKASGIHLDELSPSPDTERTNPRRAGRGSRSRRRLTLLVPSRPDRRARRVSLPRR